MSYSMPELIVNGHAMDSSHTRRTGRMTLAT
jgi:hypothetical protein